MLEESVVYQDIVHEYASRFLLWQLAERFGQLSPRLLKRVDDLPTPEIERLGKDFLKFRAKEDLTRWLRKHKKPEAQQS